MVDINQESAVESGQDTPDVVNDANPINDSPVEPAAGEAQQAAPAADQVSDAVGPSDATPAATAAEDGQAEEAEQPAPFFGGGRIGESSMSVAAARAVERGEELEKLAAEAKQRAEQAEETVGSE